MQRLDISPLSGPEMASPSEAAAFWWALQEVEVLNLDFERIEDPYDENSWKGYTSSEVDSEDEIVPVTPCFFQSVSAMTTLRSAVSNVNQQEFTSTTVWELMSNCVFEGCSHASKFGQVVV